MSITSEQETSITSEQETMIADKVAFELVPANGRDAWDASTLTQGICDPGELKSQNYKRIVRILSNDHGLPATPVNGLYFRLMNNGPGRVSDHEAARRYLPRPSRPAAGLHVLEDHDDPFALLTAKSSVLRAAGALPRAAQRLNEQVSSGALTEDSATEIKEAARNRATDLITPAISSSMQLMLPA